MRSEPLTSFRSIESIPVAYIYAGTGHNKDAFFLKKHHPADDILNYCLI